MDLLSNEFAQALNLIIQTNGFSLNNDRITWLGNNNRSASLLVDENGMYCIIYNGKNCTNNLVEAIAMLQRIVHR